MEVVVKTGGKQFFVQEGDRIQAELTGNEIGSEVELDDIYTWLWKRCHSSFFISIKLHKN